MQFTNVIFCYVFAKIFICKSFYYAKDKHYFYFYLNDIKNMFFAQVVAVHFCCFYVRDKNYFYFHFSDIKNKFFVQVVVRNTGTGRQLVQKNIID